MHRGVALLLITLLALVSATLAFAEDIRSCFVPGEDCTGVIVSEIAAARREVLVDAKHRGVDVRAILDKSNACRGGDREQGGGEAVECGKKGAIAAETLVLAKVPVLIDRAHAIAHNKVIVLDGERVITGSFNFTRAAQERNAENLLVISDKVLAARYADNWHRHAEHSEPHE